MKVPLSWLADYVSLSLSPRELADRLTMSGSLVERIHHTGSQWEDIEVARVARLERHPNADSLWLATLDLGSRTQTVVTGAPNLFEGATVPFIGVGKRLPGQSKPLEGKMLRGIRSEGMVCSASELGISDDHSGILILDDILRERAQGADPVGRSLAEVLGETVLELEITPNRPDCLAIYGIAREVAAVTGADLRPVPVALIEGPPPAEELAAVRIEASDLCSRFTGRVILDVKIGPSPAWLAERLQAAGMRSINNVVDVTNYVMLELGQPLHAYDLDTLVGHIIVVRRARPEERITTLDGAERALSPEMLVIADQEHAVGVAGVMGSAHTEVTGATRRILLEAATFNGPAVRRASVALGLRSEASSRFEKGLPRPLAALASARAAALIADLSGGTIARGMIDAGEGDPEPRRIEFPINEVQRLLGVAWDTSRIVGSLTALGFVCETVGADRLRVTIPWWRNDVDESADLVEEVARVTGYDAIPETLLRGSVPHRRVSAHQQWYAPARRLLLAAGLSEGSSPALSARQTLEMLRPPGSDDNWLAQAVPHASAISTAGGRFEPVAVVNPLSPEREILRPSLLPALLEALRDNLRHGEERVTFFEIDFCAFARPGDLPIERRTLALAMAGDRFARSWAVPVVAIDFFDLKGVIERLLVGMGLARARIAAGSHALLHPGRSALLFVDDQELGFLGELHPEIAARWDLGTRRAYVAEIDFAALAEAASDARSFADYPRLPVARRDLALVVPDQTPAADVIQVAREAGKDLVRQIALFDVYRGAQLPDGRKSLALSVELQAADHTLSEAEVERTMTRIRRALEHRLGATLRA